MVKERERETDGQRLPILAEDCRVRCPMSIHTIKTDRIARHKVMFQSLTAPNRQPLSV